MRSHELLILWYNFVFALFQRLFRGMYPQELDRVAEDGQRLYEGMKLERQILDSNFSCWLMKFAFTFQHHPEKFLSENFNNVAIRARQSPSRRRWLRHMYHDRDGFLCMDGSLLFTAVKKTSNRGWKGMGIKEAVNDFLLFLSRSRVAEDAIHEKPRLSLQVGATNLNVLFAVLTL